MNNSKGQESLLFKICGLSVLEFFVVSGILLFITATTMAMLIGLTGEHKTVNLESLRQLFSSEISSTSLSSQEAEASKLQTQLLPKLHDDFTPSQKDEPEESSMRQMIHKAKSY
jgi:hypothetical protein